MNEEILTMHNISKNYGGVHALKSVDFSIKKNEVHCLVGENGSGKSTLIKIISGVVQPEKGAEIIINHQKENHLTPIKSIQKGIQVIYQDLSVFPNLTIGENIFMNYYAKGGIQWVDWKKIRNVARETIKKVKVNLDFNETVGLLSIADRQLVAICRAIATNAQLIIMDEPTSSLARHEIDALFSVIKQLRSAGITVLFVSHKLDEVMEISERVTVLRDGSKVGLFKRTEIDDKKLSYLMTGKEFVHKKLSEKVENRKALLEVKNLSKKNEYKDINFKLYQGEILGIVGMIGSGRTELALSLFGMNSSDHGEILLEGKQVYFKSNESAIKAGISYVPEDRIDQGLIMEQTIKNNVTVTIFEKLLNHLKMIEQKKQQSTVQHWINTLSIRTSSIENPVKTLSGGNQQKIVLSKWLATNPKILILDSPTVGVDIAAKNSLYQIMRELSQRNIGIILISDEVPEILYNCHYILLMRKGRIVETFQPEEVTEKELNDKIIGDGQDE
ncbi:MAG: sugar ABC transporter ATP-binding protein [Candidatus Caldatribacteriota bacterium]|nr:sugar ABC transporter ATP-binding protein [Candidatus Caldatribacteriota bacterium]